MMPFSLSFNPSLLLVFLFYFISSSICQMAWYATKINFQSPHTIVLGNSSDFWTDGSFLSIHRTMRMNAFSGRIRMLKNSFKTFYIQNLNQSQMSHVNSNLWWPSTFLIIFPCSSRFSVSLSYIVLKNTTSNRSHVWLCQIVFIHFPYPWKLYFGLGIRLHEMEHSPLPYKTLKLMFIIKCLINLGIGTKTHYHKLW